MAKYKVGDKVKLIGDSNSTKGKYNYFGKIATIAHDDEGGEYCYTLKEGYGIYCWRDSELELVVETPREFKVGDRVIASDNIDKYHEAPGTITDIKLQFSNPYLVKFDKGGELWSKIHRLIDEEATPIPTPTPVVNVNVTVNLYENACWYCRKGGLVDLYLAGAMGICPSCGRVCNDTRGKGFKLTKIGSGVIEFKTPEKPKENKPLTTKELKALPDGTKVFVVDLDTSTKEENWVHEFTCWRTKQGDELRRKNGAFGLDSNGKFYKAYLEKPEKAVDSGQ